MRSLPHSVQSEWKYSHQTLRLPFSTALAIMNRVPLRSGYVAASENAKLWLSFLNGHSECNCDQRKLVPISTAAAAARSITEIPPNDGLCLINGQSTSIELRTVKTRNGLMRGFFFHENSKENSGGMNPTKGVNSKYPFRLI
jgi:hypothetical protein